MIGENIKKRRTELNISQDKLAEMLGYKTGSSITRIENGSRDLPIDKVAEFARVLRCSPAYLMGWTSETNPDADVQYIPSVKNGVERKMVPVLGRVSAGLPIFAESNIEYYLSTDVVGDGTYFALKVKGDSMNAARIFDGDTIIVRQQDTVDDNDIAVVLVNGDEATVKRFKKDDKNVVLIPQSTNPEHIMQIYDPKKVPIRVLGKVVKIMVELE